MKGHLVERHDSKWNGEMPRALMDMMRDVQFSIRRIINVRTMLTGAVTKSFPSLANVRAFAFGADKIAQDLRKTTRRFWGKA